MKVFWKSLVLMTIIGLVACSDGGSGVDILPSTNVPPSPAIDFFKVARAETANDAGTSIIVESGTELVFYWQTSDADRIELASENGTFTPQVVEAAGSTTVTVTESDVYTLTASSADASPVQKKIVVDVAAAMAAASILYFEPTASTLQPTESVQLCFTVEPADAEVTVTNTGTGESYAFETGQSGASDAGDDEVVVEEIAATAAMAVVAGAKTTFAAEATYSDCTVAITPGVGEHTYQLSVSSEGETVTEERTVSVAAGVRVVSFLANGESSLTLSEPGGVTLSWVVEPADAVVTLNGEVVPTSEDGTGEVVVKVTGDTTYTLSVTAGDETVTEEVVITVAPTAAANLSLSADTNSIFAGEGVYFIVEGDASGYIAIVGPNGESYNAELGENFIDVQSSGGYQAVATASDGATQAMSNAVTVTVRSWDSARGAGSSWGAAAVSSNDASIVLVGEYSGSKQLKFGTATGADAWSSSEQDVGALIKAGLGQSIQSLALDRFGPFSVNGFAFDATKDEGQRAYAAIAGAVLKSSDAGQEWSTVIALPVIDRNGSYKGKTAEHATCKGGTQSGFNGDVTHLVNFKQACDIHVDGERLLVASDHGLYYTDDVDGDGEWHGGRKSGELDPTTNIAGVVVNDLAGSQGTVFAATANGVSMSRQSGELNSWSDISGGDLAAGSAMYALAIDDATSTLYAAGEDGVVYSVSENAAAWDAVGRFEVAVYSLAVDQSNGALLAGTADGVYLSRDGGVSWSNIAGAAASEELAVRSVSVAQDSSGAVTYAIGTNDGVYVSYADGAADTGMVPEPLDDQGAETDDSSDGDGSANEGDDDAEATDDAA